MNIFTSLNHLLSSLPVSHTVCVYTLMEEVSKPPSLPPYPQMILEAIDTLNNKEGSNKSTISNYIESTYGELPVGHSTLLTENLTQMKENGEIVLVKNNYLRSDPNAPVIKRGRGRPPKVRDPAEVAAAAAAAENKGPSKGRGRPKKDPNAPPAPKKAKPEAEPSSVSEPTKAGRPRGRPKKVQPSELAHNGVEAN